MPEAHGATDEIFKVGEFAVFLLLLHSSLITDCCSLMDFDG